MDAWHAADYTSSAVDDVFYILRKCIMRSLHTGWLSADRMIKASLGVLEEEYIGVMEKRLKSTKTNLVSYSDMCKDSYITSSAVETSEQC